MQLHHRSLRLCLLTLVLAGAAGCSIDLDGDDDTTAGDESGPTGGEPTTGAIEACEGKMGADECCCFTDMGKAVRNACIAENLCETVIAACEDVDGGCSAIENPDALACTFAALAGTEKGHVSWSFTSALNPGYWRHDLDLYLMGDGTAFVFEDSYLDLSGTTRGTGRHMLNIAQHWNDCAAETDPAAQAECLRKATTGETLHCGDGFEYTID